MAMFEIGRERRKYRRIKCAFSTVLISNEEKKKEVPGAGSDIGGGGMRIVVIKELSPGDEATACFRFPGCLHPLKIKSKVIWSREFPDGGDKYEAGIQFTDLSRHDKRMLYEYILLHGDERYKILGGNWDMLYAKWLSELEVAV